MRPDAKPIEQKGRGSYTCEPVSIGLGVMAVAAMAGAAMSIQGQTQQRKAQGEYQNRQVNENERHMRENREVATRAYLDQAAGENLALAQSREAVAAANQDAKVRGLQARGTTIAGAAEGGVSGVSLDMLLADFHRQEDMMLTRNETNLVFKQQQTATNIKGFKNQAEGRITTVRPIVPGPLAPVDYFGPILGVVQTMGGAAAGAKGASKPPATTGAGNYASTNFYD